MLSSVITVIITAAVVMVVFLITLFMDEKLTPFHSIGRLPEHSTPSVPN